MIGIAVLIVVLIFTKGFNLFTGNTVKNVEETKIPISEISENAKWYEYESDGVTIRFFAVKANDGSIKTAFDACDVCYRNKKGYRQEEDYIVCNNCGRRFLINNLGVENKNPSGCWPGYLPSKVENGYLVIKKSDLEKGKWRFV
ncbi:MAG: DUF2318 domain-containing protein [Candidatus Pacearchaeota archaeon]